MISKSELVSGAEPKPRTKSKRNKIRDELFQKTGTRQRHPARCDLANSCYETRRTSCRMMKTSARASMRILNYITIIGSSHCSQLFKNPIACFIIYMNSIIWSYQCRECVCIIDCFNRWLCLCQFLSCLGWAAFMRMRRVTTTLELIGRELWILIAWEATPSIFLDSP
jgi:hypothetical protein